MSNRRRAREVVVQILFKRDLNPEPDSDAEFQFLRLRLKNDSPIVEFAERLLNGVTDHKNVIDEALEKITENWKLSRMAATDRSILRMAAFEVLFLDETPGRVAINEAIELAKRYGTNNSPKFVNGILDRLLNSTSPINPSSSRGESVETGDGGNANCE